MQNGVEVEISHKKRIKVTHRLSVAPFFFCYAGDAERVCKNQTENIGRCKTGE